MAQIIVINAHRDGTGKTNAVSNAAWIAASRGLRVAAVDADLFNPGLHVTMGLGNEVTGKSLTDHIEGDCSLTEACREISGDNDLGKSKGRLWVVPASSSQDRLARIAQTGFDAERLTRSIRQLAVSLRLDLVLVDAPAGMRPESLLVTTLADLLVVMLRPDSQDFHGTSGLLQAAQHLGISRSVLLANKTARRVDNAVMTKRLTDVFSRPVVGCLPLDEDIAAIGSRKIFVRGHRRHRWSLALEHALEGMLSSLPKPLVRTEAASA